MIIFNNSLTLANEKGELNVCKRIFSNILFSIDIFVVFLKNKDIKRSIDLLVNFSSNHLAILEDLKNLLYNCIIIIIFF